MDYRHYEKQQPWPAGPVLSRGAQTYAKRLRVLIAGVGGLENNFNHVLATNIKQWGYDPVILASSPASGNSRGEKNVEGDVLVYDMDESIHLSTLIPTTSAHMASRSENMLANYVPHWPGTKLVIVLSSRSVSRVMLEQLGAIALLHKPFDMGRLQRYLQVLQGLLHADTLAHSVLSDEGPTVARILVVDDHADLTKVIRQALLAGKQGQLTYEVRVAYDGLEALEQCLDWQPHCVLTDLIMPWMNGYQVMRCLTASPLHTTPAFVVLSALTQHEFPVNRSYLTDKVVYYVDKPFEIETLLSTVEQALAR